jgi:peroxin-3
MLGTPPTTTPSSSSTDAPLRHLLDETSDLIDSPTATHIHTLLLDTLFSQLTDTFIRQQAYKPSSSPLSSQQTSLPSSSTTYPPPPPPRITELHDDGSDPTTLTAKLATILAVMTRQAHVIGNGVLPNIYVQAMEEVKELEAFAAVVYSSHFELQGMGGRDVGSGSGATVAGEGSGSTLAEVLEAEKAAGEELPEAGKSWGIWESVWGRTDGEAAKSI